MKKILFLLLYLTVNSYSQCCTEGVNTSIPTTTSDDVHVWTANRNTLSADNQTYLATVPIAPTCQSEGVYVSVSSGIVYAIIDTLPNGHNRSATATLTTSTQTCNNPVCAVGEELNADGECVSPLSCPSGQQIFENLSGIETTCAVLIGDDVGTCSEIVPFGSSQPQAFCYGIEDNGADGADVDTSSIISAIASASANTTIAVNDTTTAVNNTTTAVNNTTTAVNNTTTAVNNTNSILDGISTEIQATSNQGHSDSIATNSILDGISSDILSVSDSASTERTTNANQAHADQVANGGKYDDIIINLRDVIESVNTIGDTAHTDATEIGDEAHVDAEGIRDAIEGLGEDEESETGMGELSDKLANLRDSVVNGESSILGSVNALLNSYTNTPPIFQGSGESTISANVFNGTLVLDFSIASKIEPFFGIIFTLLLAYANFKIYRWIFTILINIGVN